MSHDRPPGKQSSPSPAPVIQTIQINIIHKTKHLEFLIKHISIKQPIIQSHTVFDERHVLQTLLTTQYWFSLMIKLTCSTSCWFIVAAPATSGHPQASTQSIPLLKDLQETSVCLLLCKS